MIEKERSPSWFDPATADEPSERRGHPGRRVRILVRLRRDQAARELEGGAVPLEVLLAPHRADDLDGLRPLGATRFAIDVERGLLHRRGATGAPLDATLREDVGGRHLLRHARRVREAVGEQRHPEPEADVPGHLRQRTDDDFGGRAVRPSLPEVVLDEPGHVEAELVGELHLVEHLAVRALLPCPLAPRMRSCFPRSGRVDLVQQVQLHERTSGCGPITYAMIA